jgi:hypothetical protein
MTLAASIALPLASGTGAKTSPGLHTETKPLVTDPDAKHDAAAQNAAVAIKFIFFMISDCSFSQ